MNDDGSVKWSEVTRTFAIPIAAGLMALSGALWGSERRALELDRKVDVYMAEIRGSIAVMTAQIAATTQKANSTEDRQFQAIGDRRQADAQHTERLNALDREVSDLKRRIGK